MLKENDEAEGPQEPKPVIDLQAIIDAVQPDLKAAVINIIEKRVIDGFRWELDASIRSLIEDYLKTRFKPVMDALLLENEAKIKEGVRLGLESVGDAIKETIQTKVQEAMKSSYKMKAIIEALF